MLGVFQSTLPLWGATHFNMDIVLFSQISIHAPLVGSDVSSCICSSGPSISIHAPLVGSDNGRAAGNRANQRFQSTLPLWGATGVRIFAPGVQPDFNPRSPCGERHAESLFEAASLNISIHAPLVGSDGQIPDFPFLLVISIHAPLVGSDSTNSRAVSRSS